MKQLLIIPDRKDIKQSLAIAEEYGAGFEYNDFFDPNVLDDSGLCGKITEEYRQLPLPRRQLCTLHGAFYDVMVFSVDRRIREVSDLRVRQSIEIARNIGAKAVVFHTNYDPFFTWRSYIDGWLDDNEKYWSGILTEYPSMNVYFENMFDKSPDVMAELAERLCRYGNFGVCLDYAHAALTPVPHEEWARKLGKYVRHLHINDNDLTGDLHWAVGKGKIDWNEFYRLYNEYMEGASILVETASPENQRLSLEKLTADGFIKK
ncbi:MAG: sugar phosphate isomerase/epimerase [Oscillospiraceae bacterium]|nr:sugar phosphate isomerase/epimerase [Oscillospiraceae bacterium]